MKYRTFDIETAARPVDELRAFEPAFEAPGNLKDPVKIAAAIEEKRRDWYDRAALSPITGRILAIGYGEPEAIWVEGSQPHMDEAAIIRRFFGHVADSRMGAEYKLVGWNIHEFDLPFIIRRALHLGIEIPHGLLPTPGNGRFYWPSWLIDVRNVWTLGMKWEHGQGGLDTVAKFLGVGSKNGHGADFGRLFLGSDTERAQAIAYLENDIRLTMAVSGKLGVN